MKDQKKPTYVIDAGWRESAYDDIHEAYENALAWMTGKAGPRDLSVSVYEQYPTKRVFIHRITKLIRDEKFS